jgi:6-phosphogluconolactonase
MRSEPAIFSDAATAALALAEHFRTESAAAISRRSKIFAAVSGGSTPGIFFETLAREPFLDSIDWKRVEIFFVDERMVSPESRESNYRLFREAFRPEGRLPEENLHRWKTELGVEGALGDYEKELSAVPRAGDRGPGPPSFDFVLLGVGADGHTASLFPGTVALGEAERFVSPGRAPVEPRERVTLTLPVLNCARDVVFFATGESKASIVRSILSGEDPEMPAARVRPLQRPARWFLDRAAASRLSPG